VAPQEIQNLQQAAIIGDVLYVRFSKPATIRFLRRRRFTDGVTRLLPLHAFGSFLDQWEDKWDLEPATRCVAHGFRGRWKWDWGMIPARS
jgi:hypothetical protein